MPGLENTKGEDWNILANDYAKITAQVALAPIGLMLSRANALHPLSAATGILDNGCGPGPVMSRIIKDYGSVIPGTCSLTCSDFSEGMIGAVKKIKAEKEEESKEGSSATATAALWKRVGCKVQNAMDLNGIGDGSQSHVTAGMVYFMTPDPMKCLAESQRVLQPDGVLSLSAWQGSEWIELMKVLLKVRPDKTMPTMPEAWTSAKGIEGELKKAGFRDVEAHEVPVEMTFQDYGSFVEFLLGKLPHMLALTSDMGGEEIGKVKVEMVAEMKRMCLTEPGKLKGVSLVAVGRK
ncbi:Uu.00g037970.m01.CDS01 [Anthostomella pinea]|uniref:Uu.00g037970.m01.CDS01 n=1 Tax=Anthostomella pinea TaxID=933095 RepID=A0AAI8V9Q0_9PEZI|nr:Uu.00g037970.m01.CDS01 [Anthostomella pinea]